MSSLLPYYAQETPVPAINKAVIIVIHLPPLNEIIISENRSCFFLQEVFFNGRVYETLKHDKNAPKERATIGHLLS